MVNIQDQVKIGFNRLSSEIRSLSSSVPSQRQISQPKRKLIKYNDNSDDEADEIKEIARSEEEEVQEAQVSREAQEAQKNHVKKMRKEIRVNFINTLLFLNKLRL